MKKKQALKIVSYGPGPDQFDYSFLIKILKYPVKLM